MKKKVFFPALGIFLLAIAAVMLMRQAEMGRQAPPPLSPVPEKRMETALDFDPGDAVANTSWTRGDAGTMDALLDGKTGLVWSAKIENLTFVSLLEKDVRKAMGACAALKPAGAWALPTADELDSARTNGILSADPEAKLRWITYNDIGGRLVPAGRAWGASGKRIFYARCVGRAEK
jgi:hypothetical protein